MFSSSLVVKKEILQTIGGFPKHMKAGEGEDIDTWLRIIEARAVLFDSRVAAVYRCDGDGHASLRNRPAKVPCFFETLDRIVRKTPIPRFGVSPSSTPPSAILDEQPVGS